MAFGMTLWKAEGDRLTEIPQTRLESENRLENWLYEDPSLLGMDILFIGRQIATDYGGRIDLLGIDQQADLVIIELKRDKTPRDVVAQVLDYASWVKDLTYKEVNAIASKHLGQSLSEAYRAYFDEVLPDKVNTNHRMVIVASELDDSSERIVQYLAEEYSIDINAVFFSFFKTGTEELLGRAWLMDPERVINLPGQQPWSGFWFLNVGEGDHRNWDDCRVHGYISAGQGKRYMNTMQSLKKGDKVFAYLSKHGYVGFGEVTKEAEMIKDFVVEREQKRLLELDLKAPRPDENSDDPEMSEWAAGIDWKKTFPREDARTFKDAFVYPGVRCRLRDQATVDFLKREFGLED